MSCLSTGDRCSAGFSAIEKSKFLDNKLQMALDRIEAETALRLAGLDSLETCPFCPYAAEYPSVEDNKEFRCENPECAIVSCRLCRKETHLPKKCEEAVQDTVMEARRVIEEAMSDALIRRCKKCKSRFVLGILHVANSDNRSNAVHQGGWMQQNALRTSRMRPLSMLYLW